MPVLREALLRVSRSVAIKRAVTTAPVTKNVVARYVAGETTDDVVAVTRRLVGEGLTATIDHLGEDTTDLAHADAVVAAYLDLIGRLRDGLGGSPCRVSRRGVRAERGRRGARRYRHAHQ